MSNKKPNKLPRDTVSESDTYQIRQNANYTENGKAKPDNNPFWEGGSNPLSSKGN
ncbi:MAG: hypothetical protein IKI88_07345 [Anaerotignum sp.]|nr:hypothetical protein [Anaerotignum sp.]